MSWPVLIPFLPSFLLSTTHDNSDSRQLSTIDLLRLDISPGLTVQFPSLDPGYLLQNFCSSIQTIHKEATTRTNHPIPGIDASYSTPLPRLFLTSILPDPIRSQSSSDCAFRSFEDKAKFHRLPLLLSIEV
ncbi:hypothetical protein VTL71DRAFT_14365 [Oculimacula yallundae]|uniref:Uncharacterized protein n=1 Tax=Oculimacula yallundae TaxID=86028 RepID=A0ABR4CI94_9HELO